jgi:hypothetical protein
VDGLDVFAFIEVAFDALQAFVVNIDKSDDVSGASSKWISAP